MGFTYLKFYTADWLEDTASLSLKSQALWMRVICRLSKSETPGESTYTETVWARLLGIPSVEFPEFVQELIDGEVGEVEQQEDGKWTIRSNRMVSDWQEYNQVSDKRRKAGKAGGQASAKARAKARGKPNGQASAEANASSLVQQSSTNGQALPEARSQKPSLSIERESEREKTSFAEIPTWDEVWKEAQLRGILRETAQSLFDYYQGNQLWLNQHGKLIDWKYKLRNWKVKNQTIQANGTAPKRQKLNASAELERMKNAD